MKSLTARQTGIVLFLSVISFKLTILPALVYEFMQNDSWFIILIWMLIDLGALIVMLWFICKYPNMTFQQVLRKAFGNTVYRIVFAMLFVYFMVKTFFLIKEIANYCNEILFDDFQWLNFIIPMITLVGFAMTRSIRSIARTIEFFFIFIFVTMNVVVLMSIGDFDFSNFLPVLNNGIGQVISGLFLATFAFGDYLVILFFMGDIKIESKKIFKSKIVFYAFLAITTILNINMAIIGVFGVTTLNQNLALSDLTLHSSTPVTIGRLDWLTIIVWVTTLTLQACVLAYCTNKSFKYSFNVKKNKISITIILIVLCIFLLYNYINIEDLVTLVKSIPFLVFSLLLQVGLPLLLIIANLRLKRNSRIYKEKGYASTIPQISK